MKIEIIRYYYSSVFVGFSNS